MARAAGHGAGRFARAPIAVSLRRRETAQVLDETALSRLARVIDDTSFSGLVQLTRADQVLYSRARGLGSPTDRNGRGTAMDRLHLRGDWVRKGITIARSKRPGGCVPTFWSACACWPTLLSAADTYVGPTIKESWENTD